MDNLLINAFLVDYLYEEDTLDNHTQEEPQQQRQELPKKRRRRKGVAYYVDEAGVRQVLPTTMSSWYCQYLENPQIGNQWFETRFRRRFRLPYTSFVELVELVNSSDFFKRWSQTGHDAIGKKPVPIELLILASLRYLGRGWTFDDLSESTAISEEVIRNVDKSVSSCRPICVPATMIPRMSISYN